jgi:hypothetical protein
MAGSVRLLGPVVLAFGLFPLSPVAATAPVPTKSPAGPVITGVTLNPASTLLRQTCPVVLVFHGNITTTRPATVTLHMGGFPWPDLAGTSAEALTFWRKRREPQMEVGEAGENGG